jgi:hypothetical protein
MVGPHRCFDQRFYQYTGNLLIPWGFNLHGWKVLNGGGDVKLAYDSWRWLYAGTETGR